MKTKNSALILTAVLAYASTARAQLVYEPFAYNPGENLSTGTPAFTGQLNLNGSRWNSAGTSADSIVVSSPRLSARDAIHIAVMKREGIQQIMSFDAGFDGVPGIVRLAG